ncbi:hypothetical protein HBI70_124660 [Parastagonospora nodorum]|nr:hypothetical protein HBH53_094770 [Parastagonospora nodorum]KAH5269151.1 hypothetical protein HBI70_124660 [Parastagonospora nodorum]KAH5329417.1 hypothetical protein HBI11_020060 [Parastagonospora nodorum]KAH5478000.1 hypothetical protein HBI28_060700 [Parastagonospora nodorum]KAH5551878.1 hypothetical protein HBI27_012210 [Parastagonospora nodorum]
MSISTLANWVCRAFQLLFGIVILGLSVTLIRGHHWGALPATLGYAAFLGGVTIIAALIGIAAVWITFLEGIVGMAIDVFAALLNIAGGIALAIKMRGVTCNIKDNDFDDIENGFKAVYNELFNGGCMKFQKVTSCWVMSQPWSASKMENAIEGHCRESSADMVFMFLVAALFLVTAGLAFLRKRKGY